jgi:hypothetical protein
LLLVALVLLAAAALGYGFGRLGRQASLQAQPSCRNVTQAERPAEVPGGSSKVFCGTWQGEYVALHRAILEGRAPQRFAVAFTASGLSDALVGTVSVFYYALLTGRAFQVGESCRLVGFPALCACRAVRPWSQDLQGMQALRATSSLHAVPWQHVAAWIKSIRPLH